MKDCWTIELSRGEEIYVSWRAFNTWIFVLRWSVLQEVAWNVTKNSDPQCISEMLWNMKPTTFTQPAVKKGKDSKQNTLNLKQHFSNLSSYCWWFVRNPGINSLVEGKVVEIPLFTRVLSIIQTVVFSPDFWTINSISPGRSKPRLNPTPASRVCESDPMWHTWNSSHTPLSMHRTCLALEKPQVTWIMELMKQSVLERIVLVFKPSL